jgi:methylenetetrahydrofolate dehydrogenase (NADP+)/methenyltetrahydrofolate cyclohydrolase/formyltetrahydrofolate synthetase
MNVVSPEKDVDGFHPLNIGNLAIKGRKPFFIPGASKACIELLLNHGVEIKGKRVAIIGRSKIVGLPTSLLLQVTIKCYC